MPANLVRDAAQVWCGERQKVALKPAASFWGVRAFQSVAIRMLSHNNSLQADGLRPEEFKR
jgi:hypothetical protein